MSYRNPIHPRVDASNTSSFSSLSSSSSGSSRRARVPFTASSKWRSVSGHPQPSITFDYKGYPRMGMPMREIYARGEVALAQMMDRASDQVLAHTGFRRIILVIRWPGYDYAEFIRPIDVVTSSGYATRAQIAAAIVGNFAKFIERAQNESTTMPEWRVGGRGIRFDQLSLLSMSHLCEDAWQAEVAVDL